MPETITPFDARVLFEEEGEVNELIEAAYSTLNRNVAVYGELRLGEVYSVGWKALIPQLLENIERADPSVGFRDANGTKVLLEGLAQHGDLSFLKLVTEESFNARQDLFSDIMMLWRRHGVLLPCFTGIEETDAAVRDAVRDLAEHAAYITYREVWEKPRTAFTQEALSALKNAFEIGVLYRAVTYTCCSCCVTGAPPNTWGCTWTQYQSSCSGSGQGGCNAGSMNCRR